MEYRLKLNEPEQFSLLNDHQTNILKHVNNCTGFICNLNVVWIYLQYCSNLDFLTYCIGMVRMRLFKTKRCLVIIQNLTKLTTFKTKHFLFQDEKVDYCG